jgi:hypothetical protein
MRNPLVLLGGVFVVLIGLGFIMPAIAQMRETGALPTLGVVLLLLGVALTVAGGWTMCYGAKRLSV